VFSFDEVSRTGWLVVDWLRRRGGATRTRFYVGWQGPWLEQWRGRNLQREAGVDDSGLPLLLVARSSAPW